MTKKIKFLNEDPLSSLSANAKSIYNSPLVQSLLDTIGIDDDDDQDLVDRFSDIEIDTEFTDQLDDYMEQLTSEMIPFNDALRLNPDRKALIIGSSQAGVQGEVIMRLLESRGFSDFSYKAFPGMTMSSIRNVVFTGMPNKENYDVVILYPGYKLGEEIDSVIDIIESFKEPARCFVVIPPPVTEMSDTTTAAALGLNKQQEPPEDYWFRIRGGKYVEERETFSANLKAAVIKSGATAIDPRDISFSDSQPQGSRGQILYDFPDMPDGIHPTRDMAKVISSAVIDAIFSCELPVTTGSVLSKIKISDIQRAPEILRSLSDYPAASAIATKAATVSRGIGMKKHPVLGYERYHYGIDIAIPVGTTITAPLPGVVTRRVDNHPEAGSFIEITHDNRDVTRYLHMSTITPREGDPVVSGDIIGKSGGGKGIPGAGLTTGPHLHWETWKGGGYKQGTLVDPRAWLSSTPGAKMPIPYTLKDKLDKAD